MTEVRWATAGVTATRSYPDGATRALFVMQGENAGTETALRAVFAEMGAREEDPEVCLPVDLPETGRFAILPDGVVMDAALMRLHHHWGGPTSEWWTQVARVDGSVYVGLLGREHAHLLPQGLATDPKAGARLFTPELPRMPLLRMAATVPLSGWDAPSL